jgi:Calcium binding
MPDLSEKELDALVEEATVDAYGDDEQLGGFAVMIEENLEMPFETTHTCTRRTGERGSWRSGCHGRCWTRRRRSGTALRSTGRG